MSGPKGARSAEQEVPCSSCQEPCLPFHSGLCAHCVIHANFRYDDCPRCGLDVVVSVDARRMRNP